MHIVNRRWLVVAWLLAALLITGCSGKPSEADAGERIRSQIAQNSNGLIRLVAIKKTNGIDTEIGGAQGYTMEWSAELEFLGDCVWDPSSLEAIPPPQGLDAFLHLTKKRATKGSRVDLNGSTRFQKTENGWRVPGDLSAGKATGATPSVEPVLKRMDRYDSLSTALLGNDTVGPDTEVALMMIRLGTHQQKGQRMTYVWQAVRAGNMRVLVALLRE